MGSASYCVALTRCRSCLTREPFRGYRWGEEWEKRQDSGLYDRFPEKAYLVRSLASSVSNGSRGSHAAFVTIFLTESGAIGVGKEFLS